MSAAPIGPSNGGISGIKSTGNSSLPPISSNAGGNGIKGTNGANPKANLLGQGLGMGTNALDSITDKIAGDGGGAPVQPGDNVPIANSESSGSESPENTSTSPEEGFTPGEKIAPGMEVGEDGKVKQSAVSRLQNGVAQGAAGYFSGGNTEAMQAAKSLSDSRTGRRISDHLEKNKAISAAAEGAEKAGVLDAGEGVMDGMIAVKNMDIKGIAENAKKIKKGTKKLNKVRRKVILKALLFGFIGSFPFLLSIFIIMFVVASVSDENDTATEQVYMNSYEYEWQETEEGGGSGSGESGSGGTGSGDEAAGGGGNSHTIYQGHKLTEAEIQKIISEIPGWDGLSEIRKTVIRSALSAVGMTYLMGGKPTGPGLSGIPSSGIDCSGFVNWAYWTATGSNPDLGGTYGIYNNSSNKLSQVSYGTMLPGDIGVRRSGGEGHTAIYLGNNKWVHASSRKTGIKVSSNNSFGRYYAFKGA